MGGGDKHMPQPENAALGLFEEHSAVRIRERRKRRASKKLCGGGDTQ